MTPVAQHGQHDEHAPDITCPMCGTRYPEAAGRACHAGCPLHSQCGQLSCPYCGHEVPAPTALTRWAQQVLSAVGRRRRGRIGRTRGTDADQG